MRVVVVGHAVECHRPANPATLFNFQRGPENPNGKLVQGPDGDFYGTTRGGGVNFDSDGNGYGTVFKVTANGIVTTLVNFNSTNGSEPYTGLTLGNDGCFYGTTVGNGGTVFRMTTNGTLTTLVNFGVGVIDGVGPTTTLLLGKDGKLYGTTQSGGSGIYTGYGTVFRMTTNGNFTTLFRFGDTNGFAGTNGDYPDGDLATDNDGNLYGTTQASGYGGNGDGTVFKLATSGMMTTLLNYETSWLTFGPDGNLYGTTYSDGSSGFGTVFRMTTNGALTTLVNFAGGNGAYPLSGLALGSDGSFYGKTTSGGSNSFGTVFKVDTNGSLTTLANFASDHSLSAGLALGNDGKFYGTTPGSAYSGQGSDGYGSIYQVTTNGIVTTLVTYLSTNGSTPVCDLAVDTNGIFYGTSQDGGSYNSGTVFKLTTNGVFTTLVNFNSTNGADPDEGMTLGNDGNFYGTTELGGSNNTGTIFKMTTAGALTSLYSFSALGPEDSIYGTIYTNQNGAEPVGRPTQGNDGNFYGTTFYGGSGGFGTIFRITTNGLLTTLVNCNGTNGGEPLAALTLGSDGYFYGTTYFGGTLDGYGTIFKVTTNGTLTTLFNATLTEGCNSSADMIFGKDGNLYGTTESGGSDNLGTVFRITTGGVLTNLVNFNSTNGADPRGVLTLAGDGNFYGTTRNGGRSDLGTVFKLTTNGVLTTLINFAGGNGANPDVGLKLGSDGNFYGAAIRGGSGNGGTIFRLDRNVYLQSFGLTNNGFQLTAINVGGSGTVVLDASTNLANWTPIFTNLGITSLHFLDPSTTNNSKQFYRLQQL